MKKIWVVVLALFLTTNAWGQAHDRRISDNDGHVLNLTANGEIPIVTSSGTSLVTEYANSAVATGEMTGIVAGATQFASVTANMVMFKAAISNTGKVYLGGSTVTAENGATDVTTGWELGSGEATPWIPASNLNLFYIRTSVEQDGVTYMVLQ